MCFPVILNSAILKRIYLLSSKTPSLFTFFWPLSVGPPLYIAAVIFPSLSFTLHIMCHTRSWHVFLRNGSPYLPTMSSVVLTLSPQPLKFYTHPLSEYRTQLFNLSMKPPSLTSLDFLGFLCFWTSKQVLIGATKVINIVNDQLSDHWHNLFSSIVYVYFLQNRLKPKEAKCCTEGA